MRRCLENEVHAPLDKLCIYHPSADLFCPAGRRFPIQVRLRQVYQEELANYLALVEHIERRIAAATKAIKQQLKPNPRARLLMIIPGIWYPTAFTRC